MILIVLGRLVIGAWLLAIAGFVLALGWLGTLTASAALAWARHAHPAVPLRAYFQHGRRRFLATAWAAGAASEWGCYGLYGLASGGLPLTPLDAAEVLAVLAVAAACAYVLVETIEGRKMKSVFELVPADQRQGFQQFLNGQDPAAGAAGQQADLSQFDPQTVIAALRQRIVGQDAIVADVVRTTFRRAELIRPAKPLATFLFVGPTGVGKSELAKALAAELFHGRVLNLALNQMKGPQDLWSLVGPPPGYQGSERGGKLCHDLGRMGTGVLVLDEIEKAHPDIVQALMRLLDEGRITEQSTGQVYSARGFLIVATSNAAANEIGEITRVETDSDARAAKVRDALHTSGFPREIISRFDGVFPFAPLDRRAVVQVVCLMAERHAQAAGVELVAIDGELLMDLIRRQERGVDLGMRGLDRAVERAALDGLLELHKAGYTQAGVKVIDGRVEVQGVVADATAQATG